MPSETRVSGDESPRAEVLEVRQTWEDVVLDVLHFRPSTGVVRVGQRLGWRWELLGVDMGEVAEPWHRVLPWLPPLWSEVRLVALDALTADADVLHGATSHELFRFEEGAWVACLPDGARVAIGREVSRFELGGLRFEARVVAGARRTERAGWALDHAMGGALAAMGALGLGFGALVAFAPPPSEITVVEVAESVSAALMRLPPPPEDKRAPVAASEGGPAGPRSEERAPDDTPRPKAARDRDEALQAGVLSGGALDALLGSDGGLDSTLVAAAGRLAAGGKPFGGGGLGHRTGGLAGGGEIDDLGGFGPRPGRGPGGGDGLGDGPKREGGLVGGGDPPILIGGISADQVDRVIKGHLQAIRYCYQRELTRDPSLAGKVVVKFTIASDGTVSSAGAKHDTLGNAAVSSCVVDRFLRMSFPKPEGGGIAIVSYPFVFSPG